MKSVLQILTILTQIRIQLLAMIPLRIRLNNFLWIQILTEKYYFASTSVPGTLLKKK
jgi:hypothetical protein